MDDEKPEAMRQTLELPMQMHVDNEKRFKSIVQSLRLHEGRFEAIARNFDTVLDSLKRLENMAGRTSSVWTIWQAAEKRYMAADERR